MAHKHNPLGTLKIKWGCMALLALALAGCGGGGSNAAASAAAGSAAANGDTTAATVTGALAATYGLKFFKGSGSGCGAVCPYAEGQTVAVTVNADGTASIGGITLKNPFFRKFGGVANTAEVIWLDGAANVEYALTNNKTGTFNEINVGDAAKADKVLGVPGFVGQIR